MNANKITVPADVANAIAHYVNLADTKTEAFTDILRLGYEAERSEIILRHFEHDYDELMEALICGYETPEEKIRNYYTQIKEDRERLSRYNAGAEDKYFAMEMAIKATLNTFGIKVEGVNK